MQTTEMEISPYIGYESPKLILIVVKETDLAFVLHYHLSQPGYEAVIAPDHQAALGEIRRRRPDLVILDLTMTILDAHRLCTEMRSQPARATVPILVLTAKDSYEDQLKMYSVGADDYLSKPFTVEELFTRVGVQLHRSHVEANG